MLPPPPPPPNKNSNPSMLTVGEFVCAISRSKPRVGRVFVFCIIEMDDGNYYISMVSNTLCNHLGTGSLLFGSGGGNELHLLTLL